MKPDSDVVSEMPGHDLVAFYGGALHGAIRYVRLPVEIGHLYERLDERWHYDGAMFILLEQVMIPV